MRIFLSAVHRNGSRFGFATRRACVVSALELPPGDPVSSMFVTEELREIDEKLDGASNWILGAVKELATLSLDV